MLNGDQINNVASEALSLVLSGSMPTMLTVAVTGLIIGILQALTQVQDQGLPTAVKFFAVMGVLYATYLGVATSVHAFADSLFLMIERL